MMWGRKKTGSKHRLYHLWEVIQPRADTEPTRCVSRCGGVMADILDIEFDDSLLWDKYCRRCLKRKKSCA